MIIILGPQNMFFENKNNINFIEEHFPYVPTAAPHQ